DTVICRAAGLGSGRTSPALGDHGMSQPSKPQARGPARRRRRRALIEPVQVLEERALLAPYIPTNGITATYVPATGQPTATTNLGSVTVANGAALTTSAAGYASVAQLTPVSSFGGNIVRIQAGPGGDFGSGVYAIT